MEPRKIAVIGAGMCGLTAARRLADSGHAVTVFDKGRGTGGRLATRRSARGSFDHGAPFVQAESDAFHAQLAALKATPTQSGYVGEPGMSALVKPLIEGLDILNETRIESLRYEMRQWTLTDVTDQKHGPFDTVVLAVPSPQAAVLLAPVAPRIAARVALVEMIPVWTCMVAFTDLLHLPDAIGRTGVIERADRCNAKPGRDEGNERWVIHFSEEFTRANLDRDIDMIAPDLLEAFAEEMGLDLPRPLHLSAHRWRYAYVDAPLGEPFIGDPDRGLFVGGDWTLGRCAEDAWRSGQALGDAIAAVAVPAQ